MIRDVILRRHEMFVVIALIWEIILYIRKTFINHIGETIYFLILLEFWQSFLNIYNILSYRLNLYTSKIISQTQFDHLGS